MPSTVSLPTFTYKEILLYQKLNAAMAAIQARFSAGIGAADLQWPVTAEGNLNMSTFNVVGGKQIWKYINAETYGTTGTAFATAVSDAGAGGVVLVPPDTTITSDGGVNISDMGAIIGSGPSSVLKLVSAAAATNLLNATTGTYLLLSNLTLDGNSVASKIGLDLQGVAGFVCHNVWFKNFGGAAFKASASCDGVILNNCWFSGGAGDHIYVTHSGMLALSNVESDTAAGMGIRMEAAGASSYIYAMLNNVRVTGCATTPIKMLGTAAVGSATPVEFYGNNVQVTANGSGDAVILGTAAAAVQHVAWRGGRVSSSFAGGVLVNANEGSISGVTVSDPTTYCVDLDVSQYVSVSGCTLRDGTIGVDGSACGEACSAHDNLIEGCTTPIVCGSKLTQYNNTGQVGQAGETAWVATTFTSIAQGATGDTVTFTIPANTLRVGDVLIVDATSTASAGIGAGDGHFIVLDGQTAATLAYAGNSAAQYTHLTLYILTTTSAKGHVSHANGSGTHTHSAPTVTSIDVTGDMVLALNIDNESSTSGAAVGTQFVAQILRGKVV